MTIDRTEKLRQERRAKFYLIDKGSLFDIFKEGVGTPNYTYQFSNLPKDCIVDNVGWDMMRNGIVYRVLHESFEPVQEGTTVDFESLIVTTRHIKEHKD